MCLGYLDTPKKNLDEQTSHSLLPTKNCLLGTMGPSQQLRITVGDMAEKLHSHHQNMLKDVGKGREEETA